MKKILACSLVLTFVSVLAAYAQSGAGAQQGPRFFGDFKPVVGGWSEYQMTMKGEQPMKMKVAVVGREGANYWYETVMQGEMRMVTKMLVSGNPSDRQNVKRMIVKAGDEQAMEMPVGGMGMGKQQPTPQKTTGKAIDKGMETVRVPAGTFVARHMQYQEGAELVDAWVSEKVAPYGLVKSKTKDMEMVLTAQGSGARSLINEAPRKMQMPPMPKGMPQGMMPNMGGAGN